MTTDIESIGLAMDTSGVERGIRSLDELAARGPKVERSMKGVETATTAAGKGVSSLGASNAKGLDDVAKAGDRAAQGLGKTSQAARSAVSSQQALAAAVAQFTSVERSYVQSLVDEYKQLSMGRAERAAYIAQSKGMSSAAQEVARAVGQKIEAHRKEQEEAKKAVAAAESLGRAWNAVGNVIGGVAVAMAGNFSYRTFIRETIQAEQEAVAAAAATTAEDAAAIASAAAVSASRLNLGAKSVPPTVDNQGNPLTTGATYYDTTLNKWRVWNGSAWADGISAIAGVTSINGAQGALMWSTLAAYGITDATAKATVQLTAPSTMADAPLGQWASYLSTGTAGADWPTTQGTAWWNVLTLGIGTRASQIAIQAFSSGNQSGATYMRP